MVKLQEKDPEAAKSFLEGARNQFLQVSGLKEEDTCEIVRSIGLVMIKKK